MKTIIKITGQIGGNSLLARKLDTYKSTYIKKTMFNGFEIGFNSKKDASEALSQANRSIKSDEPDYYKTGVTYSQGRFLSYDASTATIHAI